MSDELFRYSGYTLEKFNTKSGYWEKVPGTISPDATEAVVPKLKEGEEYKFRVTPENDNGAGEPLETTRPVKAKNPFGELGLLFFLFDCAGVPFPTP